MGCRAMGIGDMGLETVETSGAFTIKGRLSLILVDPDGNELDRRDGDNVMCTAGLTAIANSLVWSGVQDQAANLGLTSPTFLTPLWGAVGSSATPATAADTLLNAELSRVIVGAGSSAPATPTIPAQTIWTFYFPTPATSYIVAEAGVFANGSLRSVNPAVAGTLLDHWVFSPTITVNNPNTLILQATFNIAGS
jgi:hypothetical protein